MTAAPAAAPDREWEPLPELVRPPAWVARVPWDFAPDLAEEVSLDPSPAIPTPLRPHAGGEALRLADLALARRDARDAAAQYRALLEHPHPSVKPYVELQLARAYIAQADHARAAPLLRHVLTGDSTAVWPAVLELASISIVNRHATDVLRELEPYAGKRVRLLEDYLLSRVHDEQFDALVEIALARDDDPIRGCAIERRREPPPAAAHLPPWRMCPVVLPTKPARTEVRNPQGVGLTLVFMSWASLLQLEPFRIEPWIHIAVRAALATAEAPDGPLAEISSWMTVAACYNAAAVARSQAATVTLDEDELKVIGRGVIAAHRPYLDAIIAPWLTRPAP